MHVYRTRWQVTLKHAASLDELKKSVRSDGDEGPCRSGLRSVCWKVSVCNSYDFKTYFNLYRRFSFSKLQKSRDGPGI